MIMNGLDAERTAIHSVAKLMAAAARTAPKGHGCDQLEVLILDGEEKYQLITEMRRIGEADGTKRTEFFIRDSKNVDNAPVVILLGARIRPMGVPECGYCGYTDCKSNKENDGICTFNTIDLGIAVGSAVSVAADHRIDNRVMFTAGRAALNLGLFPEGVRVAVGIPLSTSSKSPFFDRNPGAVSISGNE